jgi:two-component sensor histidine kinase
MEALERVFKTGRPAFSRAFVGSVSGRLILSIGVPVRREGAVVYDLAATLPLESVQAMIRQQRLSDQWTVAVFDQAGINFARVPNPEQTIGKSASPTLLAELFKYDEAKTITTSLERVELITAFTRSPLTGWTVAAGIPTASITQPLWQALGITVAIGAVLLAIGLGFAVRMASQLARAEALHQLLINELNHRVKNTLATVQSVAAQTFRKAPDTADAAAKFDARLMALGRAHNVLSAEKWESADVREIVNQVIDPYAARDGSRVRVSGPEIRVAPRCALMVSMVLHELATNAAKYGALSNSEGKIHVEWHRVDAEVPKLHLKWREFDGPPVSASGRRGFGSRLIEQSFAAQLGGSATLEFDPTGVICTLQCPLE